MSSCQPESLGRLIYKTSLQLRNYAEKMLAPHGLMERLSESNTDIFNGMVIVNRQITLGPDLQIEEPMALPETHAVHP